MKSNFIEQGIEFLLADIRADKKYGHVGTI